MGRLLGWMFLPFAFCISSIYCSSDSDYATPRIIILGPTGVGKSSLSSVLAGCPPGDCQFPVCTSINSCTKNTSIVEAKFMGTFSGPVDSMKTGKVTIVDTPGYGDADLEEPKLVSGEMVQVLKDDLKKANLIVLCFEGIRWDAQINAMLETLQALFGQNLWRNAIIEVTKWAFDEKAIQDRKRRGITEEDTLMAINNQLKKKFQLNHSLPGVFLDSFAVHYPNDEVQTSFFRKYSSILWETALDRKPFSLEALGKVNNRRTSSCGMDIDCCDFLTNEINALKSSFSTLSHDLTAKIQTNEMHIDIIKDNIDSNDDKIYTNTHNIKTNLDNIGTNTENIGTNTGNIATNAGDIGTNTGYIHFNANNIKTNTDHITTNTGNIETNNDNIATNTVDIKTNTDDITKLTLKTSRFVSYCGYRRYWNSVGSITYEKLVTSANSFSRGGLDIQFGVFTPPTSGTYLVSYQFSTYYRGDFDVYINYNGNDIDEGRIFSSSSNKDSDQDQAALTLTLDLKTTDTLYLRVAEVSGAIFRTSFCLTLLH